MFADDDDDDDDDEVDEKAKEKDMQKKNNNNNNRKNNTMTSEKLSRNHQDHLLKEVIPPQLMFIHMGQKQPKEVRWHPQLPNVILSGAFDGIHILKPMDFNLVENNNKNKKNKNMNLDDADADDGIEGKDDKLQKLFHYNSSKDDVDEDDDDEDDQDAMADEELQNQDAVF